MITVEKLSDLLINGKPVRKKIGETGRINIDRALPFLCLYRQPEHSDWGTRKLVQSEASYLVLPRDIPHEYARNILRIIIETQSKTFGAFLIVDVQATTQTKRTDSVTNDLSKPSFTIRADAKSEIGHTVDVLRSECEKIVVQRKRATVSTVFEPGLIDSRLTPLIKAREARHLGCRIIGLDVSCIYRNAASHYPIVLRALRRGVSRALKRTFFDFGKAETIHAPASHLALGKRAFAKAVFEVDRALADIDNSFDFLLQTTPTNSDKAWRQFKKDNYDREPRFTYRPLPLDPSLMKRRLFRVPVERIEDPTIEHLLSEKQHELDHKLSLMRLIGNKRFKYGSMQLFGAVNSKLRRTAEDILSSLPGNSVTAKKMIGARTFARRALREISHYQKTAPSFTPSVEIRDDMYDGLLVSRGTLLIGKGFSAPHRRAKALINHEVGTHLLTYHNGKAQPFHQLQIGLAGYDELQEGLGVLSEYLGGGFSRGRLRMLAGRVIAVDDMIKGAGMVDIFKTLHDDYGFSEKMAFQIALRACRGGGLTKDAIYLRGLLKVLDYIRNDGDLEILFVGKIGIEHIPLIKELQWRKVIAPMELVPRVLSGQKSKERIDILRSSQGLEPLIKEEGEVK